MTLNERILLHKVHPAKLITDASAAMLCLYFLWRRDLSLAVVIRFADLEALKQSALGIYVKRYMTPAMQLLRVCGFLVMAECKREPRFKQKQRRLVRKARAVR
jgi:hypothetical protein